MAFSWCCPLSVHLESRFEITLFQSTAFLNFLFPTPTALYNSFCFSSYSFINNISYLSEKRKKCSTNFYFLFFLGFLQDLFSPTFCAMLLLFLSHHDHDFLLLIFTCRFSLLSMWWLLCIISKGFSLQKCSKLLLPLLYLLACKLLLTVSLIYSWLTEHSFDLHSFCIIYSSG